MASYPTPVDTFDRWPDLPIRQSKTFKPDMEDYARAWLSQARKRIDAGVWEPTAVKKSRTVSQRVTMNDYYLPWLGGRTFKGRPLKAGTRYRFRKDIENHILPWFGNTRLIDITLAGDEQNSTEEHYDCVQRRERNQDDVLVCRSHGLCFSFFVLLM